MWCYPCCSHVLQDQIWWDWIFYLDKIYYQANMHVRFSSLLQTSNMLIFKFSDISLPRIRTVLFFPQWSVTWSLKWFLTGLADCRQPVCNALIHSGVDQLIPLTTCFQQPGSELLSAEKTAQNNSKKTSAVVNLENAIGFYNPAELWNFSRTPSGIICGKSGVFSELFYLGKPFCIHGNIAKNSCWERLTWFCCQRCEGLQKKVLF